MDYEENPMIRFLAGLFAIYKDTNYEDWSVMMAWLQRISTTPYNVMNDKTIAPPFTCLEPSMGLGRNPNG